MKCFLLYFFMALGFCLRASSVFQPAPNTALLVFSNSLTSAIPVSDISSNTASLFLNNTTGLVWDVNLTTFLQHGRPSDLEIYLTSPSGTRVTLSTGNGSTNNPHLFNPLTWDDQASFPVTDYVITNFTNQATLIPEGSLDKFRGENPEGVWQLTVIDSRPNYAGILSNATLTVTTLVGLDVTHTYTASTTNSTNSSLADFEQTSFNLTVTNVGRYLAQVKVQTWLKHSSCSDLDIYLISPAGTFITLTTDNAQAKADVFYGTTWNDRAASLVTEVNFTNQIPYQELVPEGALAGLKGENPNGTWTLQIVDDTESDLGTLEKWSLTLQTLPGLITDVTGDDFADIVTTRKKSVYVVPLKNGVPLGGALLAGFFPKKYRPVAVNEFTGDLQADLLLQHDSFLTIQSFSNSFLNPNSIDLGAILDQGYNVVATTDLNEDGLVDIISQKRSELGIVLAHQDSKGISYSFQQLAIGQNGKIVGADRTNLLQTIDQTLSLLPLVNKGNNFFEVGEPIVLSPAFRRSFKIAGIAELSPLSPGNEIIVKKGSTIAIGPTNLSRTIQTLYQGFGKGNIGRIVGPR